MKTRFRQNFQWLPLLCLLVALWTDMGHADVLILFQAQNQVAHFGLD